MHHLKAWKYTFPISVIAHALPVITVHMLLCVEKTWGPAQLGKYLDQKHLYSNLDPAGVVAVQKL
jgi:hypothetical protein